jgi:undecaprenyl-diphosphatase
MDWIHAILLGLVQGLTEFLPVSSSGHLRLGHAMFGNGEPELFFDIVLHVGTLLAVLGFYGRDIVNLLTDIWWSLRNQSMGRAFASSIGLRTAVFIVVASMPTAVIGLLLKETMEGPLITTDIVGGLLLLNGVMLFASRWAGGSAESGTLTEEQKAQELAHALSSMSLRNAFIVGLAQGVAVLPGISRSGSTIVTALLLGIPRTYAARLSFLLSVPAILGALALSARHGVPIASDELPMAIAGAGVAGLTGLGALFAVILVLRQARLHHFAWYCWLLGAFALLVL